MLENSLEVYRNETRDYQKEVVEEKRIELESELMNRIYYFFQK
jgi:hypothetical protein